ncbi:MULTISPECIES: hydroxyisourate hydrolase [unclassified Aureimonas]|uniref:hydroxyisourate hydrolase n=1 Tax=unclassified Aureimonas TaxID=2615206 RepID=UPI0007013DED|nr:MULTISPECIES: hydroxyisourate hydrolase [unclassified Aureimonas]KQT69954.1 5-hydroxyisourate hydrolase [Aureimonas sp. Leaf427]KQT75890.1 5-hydroxyisourate hydrolase [Aureimonas sp. Leaf460]
MADAAAGRLTTHVLDTGLGRPAAAMTLRLYAIEGSGEGARRREILTARTNADGRCDEPLLAGEAFRPGTYEIVFEAGAYLRATQGAALAEPLFLDEIPIRFGMSEAAHYHVPLLLSPFGFSTYRGS